MEETRLYEKRWWALGVLILSLLVISLDNTVMNVALPSIVRELRASASQLQWIVDAYVLVFAGLLLTGGSIGDRLGRKGALTAGLVIFGTGSALGAFAGSAGQLIATRALMGVGGALMMPATLSITTNIFPANERPKAIAIWAAISGLGFGIGPVVGGWLLERFWWGSVLLVNIPVVVVSLALGRFLVPTSKDSSAPRADVPGTLLSIAGLTSLLYGIIEAPRNGWSDSSTLMWLGIAVVLLSVFVAWELHTDHPMLDVRFFENPRFTAASLAITLAFFALAGTMFFLTQYLQFLKGYSALSAGVRILPAALAAAAGAGPGAALNKRYGAKVTVFIGLTMTAGALWLMSTVTVASGYGLAAAAMVLGGRGLGMATMPATDSIMGSLPKAKAGVGSAVNDTTREIGGALGVAILGSIMASGFGSQMAATVKTLPAQVAAVAKDSLGGALTMAGQMGGGAGRAMAEAARGAFVNGAGTALLIGAVIAFAGSLVALLFLPAREKAEGVQQVITIDIEPTEVGGLETERVA